MSKIYWEDNKLYFNDKLLLDVGGCPFKSANLILNNSVIYESPTFDESDKINIEKIIGTDECKNCGMPQNLSLYRDKTLLCIYCGNKINIKIED